MTEQKPPVLTDEEMFTPEELKPPVLTDADMFAPTEEKPPVLTDAQMMQDAPKPDYLEQISMGVKESLAPFAIEKEEFLEKQPENVGETIARVGANILTDIGSSIAVGALAGTAVAPVAGTIAGTAAGFVGGLGLAVYRALGYEKLMSGVTGEEYDLGRAALNVAVEVNPLIKIGGKGVKAVSQFALQSGQAKSYGADTETALVVGGVGGALAPLGHKHGFEPQKAATMGLSPYFLSKGMTTKTFNKKMMQLDDQGESLGLLQKAHKSMADNADVENMWARDVKFSKALDDGHFDQAYVKNPKVFDKMVSAPERKLNNTMYTKVNPLTGEKIHLAKNPAKLQFDAEMQDMARFVVPNSKKNGQELIKEAQKVIKANGWTDETAWSAYRLDKHLNKSISKDVKQKAHEIGLRDPLNSKMFENVGDLRYVFHGIEHETGLPMVSGLHKMVKAHNEHNYFMSTIIDEVNVVLKEAKKIGLDRRDIGRYLESGLETVPQKFKPAVQRAQGVLDLVRDTAIEKGVDIGHIDRYFTRVSVTPEEMIARFNMALKEYDTAQILARNTPELNDMNRVLATSVEGPLTADNINDAISKLRSAAFSKTKEGYEAMAAFARKGEFPEIIRERDFGRVALAYANNSHKAAVINPAIKHFSSMMPMLDKIGFKKSSEYLQRYIKQMSGAPSEREALRIQQATTQKASILEQLAGEDVSWAKETKLNMQLFASEMFGYASAQFYPNFLGWRIRPVVRNLMQPSLMTAPEIGGGSYGIGLAMKAWSKAVRDKAKGVNFQKELEAEGLYSGRFIGEGQNPLERSLAEALPGGKILKNIDVINDAGMWLYSKSDVVNRYTTRYMAKELASDIWDSKPQTNLFVRRLPEGTRQELNEFKRVGDKAKFDDLVKRYLIGKTQLDYGRHAMHQFGREYGRLASMFTKWPSSVGSDIYAGYKWGRTESGHFKLMRKYLAPLVMLTAMGNLVNEEGPEEAKIVFGRHMAAWAPILSTEVSAPPIISTGQLVVSGSIGLVSEAVNAVTGDLEESNFDREAMRLFKGVAPVLPLGYGLSRGLGEEIIEPLWGDK